MEMYSFFRVFVDSWFLIVMFMFFLGVCVFVFWLMLCGVCEDVVGILLCDDVPGCVKNCVVCVCKIDFLEGLYNG